VPEGQEWNEMQTVVLSAQSRSGKGKGPARALRREGKLPGVIYGGGGEPEMVAVDLKELRTALASGRFFSRICELDLGGSRVRVLPREAQLHPVTDQPLHVDFIRASAGSRLTVNVKVSFQNEAASPGLKKGGVLNIVRREVELSCPSDAIPSQLVVDLTGYDIGQSIHISAVKLPEGVKPTITGRDFTIASIVPPTTGEAMAAAAAAAAAPAPAAKAPAGKK
jgi:large subunit ribosomal protein L25